MEYFLKLFGEITVEQVVILICAAIFLYGCYKKVEKYFTEKTTRDIKKAEEFQNIIEQVGEIRNSMKDLTQKIDVVEQSVRSLKKENGEDRATTYRYRILRFDDEVRHDAKHTKEHFDQILEDIKEYETYCDNHPDFRNNRAVFAIENIERVYKMCRDQGTFL
jgi:uncharacterized protein YllA (UPF0747 family)